MGMGVTCCCRALPHPNPALEGAGAVVFSNANWTKSFRDRLRLFLAGHKPDQSFLLWIGRGSSTRGWRRTPEDDTAEILGQLACCHHAVEQDVGGYPDDQVIEGWGWCMAYVFAICAAVGVFFFIRIVADR